MLRRTSIIALLSASMLLLAGPADAARGGKGGGGPKDSDSSITLDQTGTVRHSDVVTFTVNTGDTDRPFSQVECIRGGELVYSSTKGHFDEYFAWYGEPIHYLNSLAWPSGSADCTGSLVYQAKNGRMRTLASTTFRVEE